MVRWVGVWVGVWSGGYVEDKGGIFKDFNLKNLKTAMYTR